MRWLSLVWFVFVFSGSSCFAQSLYPFDTPKQEAQFQHLLKELRCLVCQNQDLADSNAGLAKDLRKEVYQLVAQGKSDDEVIHYLSVRFGDFILFKPPVKGVTLLLWVSPFLFLSLGFIVFWMSCIRKRSYE